MNYLLSYGAAGMGDFIATMMFLRDFEQQMPADKLYLKFEIPYMEKKYSELLLNNPYWHSYDGSQHIDKVVHFGWGEDINDVEKLKLNEDCPYVYTDVIYQAFNSRANTNIIKSRPKADIFFSDEELQSVVQSDKPICVINIGYNIMHGNSRNWGWSKFQYVVDQLKDKVHFVQVGSTDSGYYHFPLNGVTNMLDKSQLRWTLRLLRQARFVITHNSSLLHLAAFDSDIKRTIYCIMGGKDYYNFFDCYDAKNVELAFVKNNQFFSKMFNSHGCHNPNEYCCDAGIVFKTGLPSVGNAKICKHPTYDEYGNILCSCYHALNPNIVINSINKHIADDNDIEDIQVNDENSVINVVISATKNYLIHMIETLNSIKKYSKYKINAHIIVDCNNNQIDDIYNKIKFIEDSSLKLMVFSSDIMNDIDESKHNMKFSKMTFAKLYIDKIFDEKTDRVMWFDTDVIVSSQQFNKLNEIQFDDSYALVEDGLSEELFYPVEMNRCNVKRYFNVGVLVLNMKKIRYDNKFNQMRDFIKNPPDWYLNGNGCICDQTIMNYILQENVKFIDPKFQVQTTVFAYPHYDTYVQKYGYLDQHDLFKNCVISHMVQKKPWDIDYESFQPHQRMYKQWQKKLYEDNVKDCISKYGSEYEFLIAFK